MKKYFFFLLITGLFACSCKSKKKASESSSASASSTAPAPASTSTVSPAEATRADSVAGNTTGKVSHKYRPDGCATVIIFMQDGTETTLIPSQKLAAEYDVDGQEIMFNYRTLKMHNPEGCNVGMPAEITDLSKK